MREEEKNMDTNFVEIVDASPKGGPTCFISLLFHSACNGNNFSLHLNSLPHTK